MNNTQSLVLVLITSTLLACSEPQQENAVVIEGVELVSLTAGSDEYVNSGKTIPKPVFQLGDVPSQPIAEGSVAAQEFINFFNQTYLADKPGIELPLLTKKDVVWFPPQSAGDTSLELVARALPGQASNCDDPKTYPLYCNESFSSGEFCKACHDSVLFVEGGGLQQMAYFSEQYSADEHQVWLANWSQYGDWSANIMRLATRDPIWQAQIETETNKHPFADPAVLQDVCFSCHGEMGERQLKFDHGPQQTYCTDLFYATVPGYLSDDERGKPYEFTGDCEPIEDKPIGENQALYAKYGSLARDGVSCETCHRIGPEGAAGQWNGTDFQVFYGPDNTYNVSKRQVDNPVPLTNEFTATFSYDMDNIMVPDPVGSLDPVPMMVDDNLSIAQAVNQKNNESYLGQSILCGACHVLIVPQIPRAFKPDGPLPDTTQALRDKYPNYKRPLSCGPEQTTFAPATNAPYGNPVLDLCVSLGYEQATYLEWINSSFASEQDNENTCQGCHMPLVTDPDNTTNHTAIMAQSTQGLSPKDYRRHRMMGINLPVFEMYLQFPEVLGVDQVDDNVPPQGGTNNSDQVDFIQNYLLNGQMAIVEQATSQANGNGLEANTGIPSPQAAAEISVDSLTLSNDMLTAELTVTNNTGHKFPSGAGFRRGFLKFEVLDHEGKTLWVSGDTNPFGAICEGLCMQKADGSYNLLASETPGTTPSNLQPHYAIVNSEEQVQIYEVQSVDDQNYLTSETLSLFDEAKDNRLLPKGFVTAQELGCETNPGAGTKIFGIAQCSAAYGAKPQLDPQTTNSAIGTDKHYTNSSYAGSDQISYKIDTAEFEGTTPASVRVTMQYQTIPPNYLASRFSDGFDQATGRFLPATERSIYLTSHLNTNLGLKSEHPDNPDLVFSKNWTQSIHQVQRSID